MALLLAPYTPAMRIGQGFNSYTHEICVNDAVVVDREHPSGDHYGDSGQVSQIVTYSTRYVDKVSQVSDAMNVSAALSIKSGTLGGAASGSYVDSSKFKDSNINFFVQVKVTNQVIMAEDVTLFQDIPTLKVQSDFTKVFGDCFISGFIEGGELDAIVSIKTFDKQAETSIKAALEANFGKGGVGGSLNVGFAKDHAMALNGSETSITVNWNGGGAIKNKDDLWSIETLTKAAAAFPENVSKTPQRTYAILTKYTNLRSYQMQRTMSPLSYDGVDLYTNDLLDAYMDYKTIWQSIHIAAVGVEFDKVTLKLSDRKHDSSQNDLSRKTHDRRNLGFEDVIRHVENNRAATHEENMAWLNGSALNRKTRDHDGKPYDPTFDGLEKAKMDCRAEMLKIINEVDTITKQPDLALDPNRDIGYINPAKFRWLLPQSEPVPVNATSATPAGPPRARLYTDSDKPLPASVQKWVETIDTTEIASRRRMSPYAGDHNASHDPPMTHHWDRISSPEADSGVMERILVWTDQKHIRAIQIQYVQNPKLELLYGTAGNEKPQPYPVHKDARITRVDLYVGVNDSGNTKTLYGIRVFSAKDEAGFFLGVTGKEKPQDLIKTQAPSQGWSFRGLWTQADVGDGFERVGVFWGLDK